MLNNFSPNMLKTYIQCPKKFYLRYIEKLNIPQSLTPFEKGKKIHALADYFMRRVNISRIETALSESEILTWGNLLNNEYFRKTPLKSEYQLSCKVGKYWVCGRIDAIVHDFDEYYILDYKTGSIPKDPQFDFQTMIYLLATDKVLEYYNSLSFVYINLKNNTNHIIKFDQKLKSLYQEKITNLCELILADSSFISKCENCKNCEYKNYCQM